AFQREFARKIRLAESVRAKHTINEDDVISIASVDPRIIRHCHTQELDDVFSLTSIDLQVPGNWRKSRNHFNPDKVIAAFHLDIDVVDYALNLRPAGVTVDRCLRTACYDNSLAT